MNNRYSKVIALLSSLFCVLLAALAILIIVSQPGVSLEKTAEAETSALPGLTPMAKKAAENSKPTTETPSESTATPDPQTNTSPQKSSNTSSTQDDFDLDEVEEYLARTQKMLEPDPKPTERIYSDVRYLTTFLAFGRYMDLPGAKEIYLNLLDTLGIEFTGYATLSDEIEAVADTLSRHPDLWQQTADDLLATGVLPDDTISSKVTSPSTTTFETTTTASPNTSAAN